MTDPNSHNLPEGTPPQPPSVFEPAAAPTASPSPSTDNSSVESYPGVPIYQPALEPAPITPPYGLPVVPVRPQPRPLDTTGDFSHRIPRWRWFMSLLLIGMYPAMASLLSLFLRPHSRKRTAALPQSVPGLALYLAIDLAIFGVLWGLGWAFSRANKDELLMRWRDGAKPVLLGFAYALGIRVAIMFIAMFLLIVVAIGFAATGHDPKMLAKLIQDNSPNADTLFPKGALSNPLYLLFTVTVLSFVAAGGREEIWRTSCLAALRHLFPDSWSTNARWISAIVLSSVIFGLGHVYQGAVGVVMTSIIGVGLGIMTWRYRSIWPSVWAHGFFDATSFLLAAVVSLGGAGKKLPVPPTWFLWWG